MTEKTQTPPCSPECTVLLPCPFCGGDGLRGYDGPLDGSGVWPIIFCAVCKAKTDRANSANFASQLWNTRAARPPGTRDGTAIVAEWELIGSAPTDGCFLVCDINDDRGPFLPLIVSAKIFWMARKEDTPSHLRLAHMTHWMPLPAPPSPVSRPNRNGDDADPR
jgi:hypothetical protein